MTFVREVREFPSNNRNILELCYRAHQTRRTHNLDLIKKRRSANRIKIKRKEERRKIHLRVWI